MENRTQQNFLLGALVGGALAAAAALFITPASGARIKQRVRNAINRLQRRKVRRGHASARRSSHRNSHVMANGARKHKRAHAMR